MNVRDLVPWSRGDRERSPATRTDSLNPVMSLHREMNRLFDDVFRGFDDSRLFAGRSGWPSMDVEETDKEYRVTAELPGLEERDVEVAASGRPAHRSGRKEAGIRESQSHLQRAVLRPLRATDYARSGC